MNFEQNDPYPGEIPEGCIENKDCKPPLPKNKKSSHIYYLDDDFAVSFYKEKYICTRKLYQMSQ